MNKGFYFSFRMKNALSFTVTLVLFFSLAVMLNFSDVLFDSVSVTAENLPVIIIDPGHGGEDGGTQSSDGTLEKQINLEISEKINALIKDYGFNTVMTREGDYMIYDESASTQREKKVSDIHNRLNLVEETGDCILLSVHQNYFRESKYSGTQVFYSKNNPGSKALAEEIQSSVVSALQPDNTRQIKESGIDIYLLYHSAVPSVMVECGFMSNDAEAEKLKDEVYQQKLSEAIVAGLIRYIEIKNEGETDNGNKDEEHLRLQ
ncbi:MAG: N-acetylmuramoyl-L-alanine amidase [Clostridia bacterium]|nr:N-acetylmuramoyl-L-alanine amidase [Clostridia bacterium]